MSRDEFLGTILGKLYDLIACYLIHEGVAKEVRKKTKKHYTFDEALAVLR